MLRLLVFLVLAVPAYADPPKSRWPATPVAAPEKSPAPVAVTIIDATDWFIIERDEPAIALCSPDGLVSFKYVTNDAACLVKYKGTFAGGGGKREEKTFSGKFIIEVTAVKTGRCEIFLVPQAVKAEADVERRTVDVKAGDGAQPPPIVNPPTPTTGLYFLIIRPDGPAHPTFTAAMSDPAWAELGKRHLFKDKTLAESRTFNVDIPNGTLLPCVVTLKYNPDGKTMSQVRGPVAFPTTADLILKLPEGVK